MGCDGDRGPERSALWLSWYLRWQRCQRYADWVAGRPNGQYLQVRGRRTRCSMAARTRASAWILRCWRMEPNRNAQLVHPKWGNHTERHPWLLCVRLSKLMER